MVETALQNDACRGIQIVGRGQEISQLTVPADTYDVVWLSAARYSSIPTRQRRTAMLKRIATALKSSGYFICSLTGIRIRRFPLRLNGREKVLLF